jgi:hypothetical protein
VVATEATLFAAPAFKAERAAVLVRKSVADMITGSTDLIVRFLSLRRI